MVDKVLPGQAIQPINRVEPKTPGALIKPQVSLSENGIAFRQLLDETLRSQGGLKFSAHALRRMESRGIRLAEPQIKQIELAVEQAEAKGSRDSLIVSREYAMLVNVPSRTVVTAFDQQQMLENVVTNIDSTVFMGG